LVILALGRSSDELLRAMILLQTYRISAEYLISPMILTNS
jgi:hypothetical protein